MDEGIRRRLGVLEGLAFNSLKGLIEWGDDLKVGEPGIDSQHEQIFKLAAASNELAISRNDLGKLLEAFEEFGKLLQNHCRYEEGWLAENRYPKLAEHQAQHEAMLSEFNFIRQRLANKSEGWAFEQQALVIVNYTIGVTVGHILHSDADYARHGYNR